MIKEIEKSVKWVPFFSFAALIVLLLTSAQGMASTAVALILINVILGVMAFVSFFPDHSKEITSFWTDKVLIEVHYLLIFVSICVSMYALLFLSKRVNIMIEWKGEAR